ncbi:MAG: ATP-grasp domain-containing protein [Clostridia bacterium]|nr:ATP-grasp domain-containing protein [Clostridia bacterium]
MKKALVLAGGIPQIELIQELKKRGYFTILADYYENPVAKPYADKFYQESTLDLEAIEKIAVDEKVEFIITVCTDQAVHTMAYVSEKLGLPCYIDYKTALNVTNKEYMKKVFVEKNISTAKHVSVKAFDVSAVEDMSFPLIVKPADCNSSKGVKKVTDICELEEAVLTALAYSRTDTAIIEEFIEGEEISVDAYIEDGVAHILCVSNNDKIKDAEKFVIFRGRYPANDLEYVNDKIQTTVQQIADAFGLKNTPMLVQMINTGSDVYVLEFCARTGGGVKFVMIDHASSFHVINAVIDLTMGKKPHVSEIKQRHKYFANEFVYCNEGVFDHLEGFEELKQEGIIEDYYLFKWKGVTLRGVASSGDRICGFSIAADSKEELERLHNIVCSSVKVIDENGQDMMNHDLLTCL